MVDITPAILTTEKDELRRLLKSYIEIGFNAIDIDIQSEGFVSDSTISFEEAFEVVKTANIPVDVSIGWDLKLKQPKAAVEAILASALLFENRIYIYSSAEIDFLESYDLEQENIKVAVLGSIAMKGIKFFERFEEVQFMTIGSEKQGGKLDVDLLDRTTKLREMGYMGKISIDGGINLRSAEIVNAYAKEVGIGRVSVGSFFQKSQNLELDKQKLELALNI